MPKVDKKLDLEISRAVTVFVRENFHDTTLNDVIAGMSLAFGQLVGQAVRPKLGKDVAQKVHDDTALAVTKAAVAAITAHLPPPDRKAMN